MITLIAVSDGHKHFSDAIREYEKRLSKIIKIKLLKPISHKEIEYIRIKETLSLLEYLRKTQWTIILLDERGKSFSTIDMVDTIEWSRNSGENITFVIGGSYGVDLELFAEIPHKTIRISDFVMPHALAYLILLEQLYRAHEIIKGSGYHHS